jgi:hypothetical protein
VRRIAGCNIAVKVLLVAFLLHGVLFPDLPQYQGKGMGWRLLLYPLTALLVPIIWYLRGRRPQPYPHHLDLVVALPFLLDTAGNTFDLFDRIGWWDDFMHVLNWIPWVMVAGFIARYRPLGKLNVAVLAWGYGAITHILWEEAEFLAFVQDNPNESTGAYRDTMGDLILSLAGGLIGAVLLSTVLWNPVGRWTTTCSAEPALAGTA